MLGAIPRAHRAAHIPTAKSLPTDAFIHGSTGLRLSRFRLYFGTIRGLGSNDPCRRMASTERGSLDSSPKSQKYRLRQHSAYQGNTMMISRRSHAEGSPHPAHRFAALVPAVRAVQPLLFEALVQCSGSFEIESLAGGFALAFEVPAVSAPPAVSSVPATSATSASYSSFVQPAKHGARHIFISE